MRLPLDTQAMEDGDLDWWDTLCTSLQDVKTEKHENDILKGFYKPRRLPRSCLRMVLGLQGQPYNDWTLAGKVKASVFDRLQWSCFKYLYLYCTQEYPKPSLKNQSKVSVSQSSLVSGSGFKASPEFAQYQEVCKKREERRLQDMYFRAKDVRKQGIEKWVTNIFMDKHLALYRKAEHCSELAHNRIADALLDRAIDVLVRGCLVRGLICWDV